MPFNRKLNLKRYLRDNTGGLGVKFNKIYKYLTFYVINKL